jgi:signal transduction histidine kinase
VPPDVGAAAFRIVQESLTNTLRHARARTVHVGLDWSDAGLSVAVVDDGTVAGAPRSPGYGLIGLRERAVACGGTIQAGPEPAGGFAVRAQLPVPA